MLTGKYTRRDELPADGRLSRGSDMEAEGMRMLTLTDRNFEIVAEVGKVADELGSTPTAVSLAWLLNRPGVTSVIIGPRTSISWPRIWPDSSWPCPVSRPKA